MDGDVAHHHESFDLILVSSDDKRVFSVAFLPKFTLNSQLEIPANSVSHIIIIISRPFVFPRSVIVLPRSIIRIASRSTVRIMTLRVVVRSRLVVVVVIRLVVAAWWVVIGVGV